VGDAARRSLGRRRAAAARISGWLRLLAFAASDRRLATATGPASVPVQHLRHRADERLLGEHPDESHAGDVEAGRGDCPAFLQYLLARDARQSSCLAIVSNSLDQSVGCILDRIERKQLHLQPPMRDRVQLALGWPTNRRQRNGRYGRHVSSLGGARRGQIEIRATTRLT
jgi:hypothetical protein